MLVGRSQRSLLVESKSCRGGDLCWNDFRNSFERDLRSGDARRAFGLRLRKDLNVAVAAVVENQHFTHGLFLVEGCVEGASQKTSHEHVVCRGVV